MKSLIQKTIFPLILLFVIEKSAAQDYLYEIGPTTGASFYSGDVNNYKMFDQPESVVGLSLRRNFNFRTALKFDFLKASVSSNTNNTNNVLPITGTAQFKTGFIDVNAHLEYSFFSYSDSFKYKETRRLTPYIFAGIGATVVTTPTSMTRLNIPVGIGLKYKIFHRLNIGTELSMNMLLSDRLERIQQFDDPYLMNSYTTSKNNDWYSYLKFYITFDIIKRGCNCNKNK